MKKIMFLIVLGTATLFMQAQNIRYVKQGEAGDGQNWNTPSGDIQAMINELSDMIQQGQIAEGQVWVTGGTYQPNRRANALYTLTSGDKDNAFVLRPNVKLYGGYNATFTDRNFTSYPSILNGYDNYYHVVISAGNVGTACLDGFTIRQGNANGAGSISVNSNSILQIYGGGVFIKNSSPALANLIIKSNKASSCGGGLYIGSQSNPTLSDVEICENGFYSISNVTTQYGGGICIEYSSPILNNVIIRTNFCNRNGGGMYIEHNNSTPILMDNVIFDDNQAYNNGGGIYIEQSSPLLNNVIIRNNDTHPFMTTNGGGGIYISAYSSPVLTDVEIYNNQTFASGGGIYISASSSPVLTNITIRDNSSSSSGYGGGGMYIGAYSSPALTNVVINDNYTSNSGGGMYIFGYSSPVLTNVTISNNVSSSGLGGGMYIGAYSNFLLTNVLIHRNMAYSNGGGIHVVESNIELFNVSITENSTYNKGGGINIANAATNSCNLTNVVLAKNLAYEGGAAYYDDIGTCTMTNVTVTANGSTNGSVIVCSQNASVTLNNSIVYGNMPTLPPYIPPNPTFNNIVYNYSLIENGNLNNPGINNILLPTDPKFLNSSGSNYRLSRHSPCCNAGNNSLYQTVRGISNFTGEKELGGNARLYGTAIDMGAYENHGVNHNGSGVFFVKQRTTGKGKQNGSSWADAFDDLATALEEIPLCSYLTPEIWVADGTYYPTKAPVYSPTSTDCAKSFEFSSCFVKICGGFPADANDVQHKSLNDRGSLAYGQKKTILSGEIASNNNSYHVVKFLNTVSELDGFVIEGGYADGVGSNAQGGGIYAEDGYPVLINVEIRNNGAIDGGGMMLKGTPGLYLDALWLENVDIYDNEADFGGGICSDNATFIIMDNVKIANNTAQKGGGYYNANLQNYYYEIEKLEISNNTAQNGGGMYIDNSDIDYFSNISIIDNEAIDEGGGIYINNSSGNTCNLGIMLLANNIADKGGAIFMENGSCTMTNVTVAGNEDTLSDLHGIYRLNTNNSPLTIYNSILYGNTTSTSTDTTNMTFDYSLVENISFSNPSTNLGDNTDPLFINVVNGNYRLNYNSPVINKGNNTFLSSNLGNVTIDMDGNARIYGDTVDMGAYESTGTNSTIAPDANGIVYIKKGSTGDGSSWNNAAGEVADALLAAASNTSITQIWVAEGDYKPLYPADGSSTDPRDMAFVLPDNVSVCGGFPANSSNGTNMSHWNWQAYPTVLSGYLGQINNQHTYTYHVVIAAGGSSSSKSMNGFTIEYGIASGTGNISVNGCNIQRNNGGGIYVISTNTGLQNMIVQNCQANNFGGGVYNMSSEIAMGHVWTMNNVANYGGGIYSEDILPSSPEWKYNSVIENHAKVHGGGMYNRNHNHMFLNFYICGNKADAKGSAIFNNNASPEYHSTLIAQNEMIGTPSGTGCIFNDVSSPTFYNTTIAMCMPDGIGMVNDNSSFPYLCNSIIWSGNLLQGGQQPVLDFGSTTTYHHCLIQNMQPAGNNLPGGTNPDFINPVQFSSYQTNYGDYHLMLNSQCIDWGDNACATGATGIDLNYANANPRILNNIVDLGCYEFNSANPNPVNDPYHKRMGSGNTLPKQEQTVSISNMQLKVYPNPISGGQQPSLFLGEDNLYYDHAVDVKVYSLEGKQIHSKTYSNGNIALDIPQLSSGIYVINVRTQEGKVYNSKLVITQ
ncbi:MAG: right-handed parallel beta-helix repeat-containing protein [Bacteroidales bacterium]|jgi:hypothetical protein|nr:right-handed parallel beta-helix repeat-containing protein [Bacteroidales bacterium]